jgi:GNAT superfamily N-acetyltransferase
MVVRVADAGDIGALASLRSLWRPGAGEDPEFEGRMAAWLAVEGDRRTTMFVREDVRNRGIGSALLTTIITAAEERRYARLVVSPGARAVPFFQPAGFIVPDDAAGDDRLLVRPGRPGAAPQSSNSA